MNTRHFLFILFSLIISSLFAQKPLKYTLNLPIESSKKKNIELITKNWLLEQNAQIIKTNKDTLWAYGQINFTNTIVYQESKTYNRVYREQSNGKIVFRIKLFKESNRIVAELSQFKHQPSMKFDNLSFGIITDQSSAPKEVTEMTNDTYSKEVWNLIKQEINNYTIELKGESKKMVSRD